MDQTPGVSELIPGGERDNWCHLHNYEGRYAHRNIHIVFVKRGIQLDLKTVLKLMKPVHLTCWVRMKKYRSYRGIVGKVASNVLDRDLSAEKPNQKWVTDVVVFVLFSQKHYLSPVPELYNSEGIAYTVQSRPTFNLVSTSESSLCKKQL